MHFKLKHKKYKNIYIIQLIKKTNPLYAVRVARCQEKGRGLKSAEEQRL